MGTLNNDELKFGIKFALKNRHKLFANVWEGDVVSYLDGAKQVLLIKGTVLTKPKLQEL